MRAGWVNPLELGGRAKEVPDLGLNLRDETVQRRGVGVQRAQRAAYRVGGWQNGIRGRKAVRLSMDWR